MLEREEPRALPLSNGYAGDIPANSAVIVSSATRRVVTVSRPTAANATTILVTGFQVCKQSGRGHASAAWPLWVKYNGTLAAGGSLGTAANSFEMTGGNTGFTALVVDATNHLALIIPATGGLAIGAADPLPIGPVSQGTGTTVPRIDHRHATYNYGEALASDTDIYSTPLVDLFTATVEVGTYLAWFQVTVTVGGAPATGEMQISAAAAVSSGRIGLMQSDTDTRVLVTPPFYTAGSITFSARLTAAGNALKDQTLYSALRVG